MLAVLFSCSKASDTIHVNSVCFCKTQVNSIDVWSITQLEDFVNLKWTPVLDFWWCRPWLSMPGLISGLHSYSSPCNGFLRLTSGVTPTNFILVSITAKPEHNSLQNMATWHCLIFLFPIECNKITASQTQLES